MRERRIGYRAMLDARFSHLYFCQRLHTLQRGLAAIADLLVICVHVYTVSCMRECVYVFHFSLLIFCLCADFFVFNFVLLRM